MTNLELLDSKRFCAFMDTVGPRWEQGDDSDKAKLLEEIQGWLPGRNHVARLVPLQENPAHVQVRLEPIAAVEGFTVPKRKGGRPKGSKNAPKVSEEDAKDRAALKAEHTRELTAEEKRQVLADLAKQTPARDPQLIVNDAVAEVIVPNWAKTPVGPDGHRHFIVNAERKGERVSFELDKWKAALTLNKLAAGSVVFKPEGLGMSPGSLETGRAGNAWRVMIG